MKNSGFSKNVQIRYIGQIFKNSHSKMWNLELCVRDGHTNLLKQTCLSNLPAIAKRRYINPSDGQSRKGGYPLALDNITTSNWQVGIDSESDGNTFVFYYNNDHLSGIKVHIPQIEFARILFFHNAYLARNCMDNGILSREFQITETADNSILINIPITCTLSLETFNSEGQRRLLAWILLDSNARNSYVSIAKYHNTKPVGNNDIEPKHFQFQPPNLTNFSLDTTGWLDKKTNNYYVHEVIGISNIQSSISKKVYFHSEKFKVGTQASSKGINTRGNDYTSNDSIDDQQNADFDTEIKKIDIPKTFLSFTNPIETRKVAKSKAKGRLDSDIEPKDEFIELDLNTDDSTIDGTACQAEFLGLDDQSNDLELYVQRFEAFKLLIERLSESNNIYCDENLHFLPAVGRSRLHRTIDGNKRSLLEVKVKTDTAEFIILEVDMNDTDRLLSTLIVKIEDTERWNAKFESLLKLIVQRSINWPTDEYLKKFGMVKRMKHPLNSFELTETSIEFAGWLNRLTNILKT